MASKSFTITTIQNHLQKKSPNKKKHYGWILEAPQPGFSPDDLSARKSPRLLDRSFLFLKFSSTRIFRHPTFAKRPI